MTHPLPANEVDRLQALEYLRGLEEGTEDAAALDRLAQVARSIFGTPIALVALMGSERQWFEAHLGTDMCEAGRDASLCAHVVASAEPLVVPDATRDPRFAASPLVTGEPRVRFYAGAPLLTDEGHALGTLCVIDTEPHPHPDDEKLEMLRHLASAVLVLLKQRAAALRDQASLTSSEAELVRTKERLAFLLEASPATIYACEPTPPYRATFVSPNIQSVLGYSASDFLDDPDFWPAHLHPVDADAMMEQGIDPGERPVIEYRFQHADGSYRWLRDELEAVTNERDEVVEFVGSLQDVTEERVAREEAERANERAVRDYADLLQRVTALAEGVGLAEGHEGMYRALFDFARASTPADSLIVAHYDAEAEMRQYVYVGVMAYDAFEEIDVSELPRRPLNGNPQSRAITTRQPIITHDLQAVLAGLPTINVGSDFDERPPLSSVAVPMTVLGEIIGVIELQSTQTEAFRPEHITALQMAANLAAIAAKNVQLLQREQRARKQVETQHARLRELTEQAPALMATLEGPDHVYTTANALYLETVGKQDIVGQRVADVLPEVEAQGIIEILDQVYRTGESFVAHAMPIDLDTTNNGELRRLYFDLAYQALRDADGNITGVLAHAVNVTEQSRSRLELERLNTELRHAYDRTIEGWARALDLKDEETAGHSQRVTDMTVQLARHAGIPEEELEHIRRGALLHDIGKMAVPDSILLKPGGLTEEEWSVMRQHPEHAHDFLAPIAFLQPALDIPYCHHEKWDGSGYPRRLKGEQIPLAARIFAVVDVFDALTSDRPYRAAWPVARALEHIREQSGTHFDPTVVEAFFDLMQDAVQGAEEAQVLISTLN